jgi:hypothetical protein
VDRVSAGLEVCSGLFYYTVDCAVTGWSEKTCHKLHTVPMILCIRPGRGSCVPSLLLNLHQS